MMRFAVLGCGSIGQRHLRNIRALKHAGIIVYDLDPTRLAKIELGAKISTCNTLDAVWDFKPDVAFVTTPTHLHLELACLAAEQGIHLFIEKPLSHQLDGVDRLLTLVEQNQLITMVGCNMRFLGGPLLVKQWLDEGHIGQPIHARVHTGSYLPNWRPGVDYKKTYSASYEQGGGAILDQIHEIDLALWYFGAATQISAMTVPATSIDVDVEGLGEITLVHRSGVLSSVHLNFIQTNYHRYCQIIGTEGSIYWDFDWPEVRCFLSQKNEWHAQQVSCDWDQIFIDELAYFIQCVETGKESFSSVTDGMAALRVAFSAKLSAEKGLVVKLGE